MEQKNSGLHFTTIALLLLQCRMKLQNGWNIVGYIKEIKIKINKPKKVATSDSEQLESPIIITLLVNGR